MPVIIDPREAYLFRQWTEPASTGFVLDLPEWRSRGACNGADPDLFFPERGASTREAKAICAGCPVREECLAYALDTRELFGIWGGTSERERRRLRRQRGSSAAARTVRKQTWHQRASEMRADGRTLTEIAIELGVHYESVRRYFDDVRKGVA